MKLDAEGNEGSAKGARRLDLATWQLAWDRYTVAAVALDQLSFAQCQVHKDVVMEVAAGEAKNGGSAAIGVYYDAEFGPFGRTRSRNEARGLIWRSRCSAKMSSFCVEQKRPLESREWYVLVQQLLCLCMRRVMQVAKGAGKQDRFGGAGGGQDSDKGKGGKGKRFSQQPESEQKSAKLTKIQCFKCPSSNC